MPVVGLEPTQYCYQWILSPSCLPIPPYRHKNIISYFYYSSSIIPLSVVISIIFKIDKVEVIKSSKFISTSLKWLVLSLELFLYYNHLINLTKNSTKIWRCHVMSLNHFYAKIYFIHEIFWALHSIFLLWSRVHFALQPI